MKNKENTRKLGIGISLTGPGVGLKISFTGKNSQDPGLRSNSLEILLPTSVQAYGDTMQLSVVCHSAKNFGIYVNGQWQANYTEISEDFVPYFYNIITPESKDNVEFLNVETRQDN